MLTLDIDTHNFIEQFFHRRTAQKFNLEMETTKEKLENLQDKIRQVADRL